MEEMVVRNVSLPAVAGEVAVKKGSEFAVDRILNWLIDNLKAANGTVRAAFKTGFTRYLKNATLRYNQVRTLATPLAPRTISGRDSIYVNIGVKHENRVLPTDTVEDVLRVSKHILILGTGGVGKSMLMRHLFINTANNGSYVPVLLELRKISNHSSGSISIIDLIYSCMEEFDVALPRDEFEYSLRLGKYLFLLDGFDEVRSEIALETAEAIQAFCSKYPNNPCIVTSRPREDSTPLQTFTTMKALPLTKEQAVLLASKIWPEDDKTIEFCRQLKDNLYDTHKEFAENPLLLTMMFLTFMRNNSIPNHLSEFYEKAFEALYSAHDNNDKGVYHREFRCMDLDEVAFKGILAHFCFHSYFKEKYEFSENELVEYVEKSIKKMEATGVAARDYVDDLCKVVCFLVKEGNVYRFAHRSFQAYFAAYYTARYLTDEKQQYAFREKLTKEYYFVKREYYVLLYQMEPERFVINALEDTLREIHLKASLSPDPDYYYLQLTTDTVAFNGEAQHVTGWILQSKSADLETNCVWVFKEVVLKEKRSKNFREHFLTINELLGCYYENDLESIVVVVDENGIRFECEYEMDHLIIANMTETLKKLQGVTGMHHTISVALDRIYDSRAALSEDDFFDEL